MAIEDDYLIKQIKAIAKVISKLLFKRDDFEYVLPKDGNYSDIDNLYIEIMDLAKKGEYNKAEDMLFNALDGHTTQYMQIAIMFYTELATKDEKDLIEHNFSRAEVEQGFLDMLRTYNVKIDKA